MKFQLIRPFVAVVLLLQAGFLWAQTNDSAKVNKLSFGIDFMTHGEMMRGGLPIDLDDGVKVNYAKFQDVLEKIK